MHLVILFFIGQLADASQCPSGKFALVIHGGAGDWNLSAPVWKQYQAHLDKMLQEGHNTLSQGGSSLDAVEAIVQRMEDSGILNAGKGGVRNAEGVVELDASIMDGKTLKAGAVAAVKTLKNPIQAARKVMERTKHLLLVATGAETFGSKNGVTVVPASYFEEVNPESPRESRYGTVGAVAIDCFGNLAAATSTGGLTGKLPGRVGDSPIIGAGTYADNNTCAVSATGTGEYFIRVGVARDISAMMEYKKRTLEEAGLEAIRKVGALGGDGGVISIDLNGRIAMPFNTKAMIRGYIREDGKAITLLN